MKYEIKQAGALGRTVYIYENDIIREAGMLGKVKYIVKDGYIKEPGVFGKTVYKIDGNIVKTPGIFGKKVYSIENNCVYQGFNLIYKIVPVGERPKENATEQTNKNVNFNVDFTITEVFKKPEYNELLAYRTFFNKYRTIKAPDRQETYSNWALASCGVEDPKKLHRELFDKGYYSESSIKDCLSTHKLSELKDFANSLNIAVKGKKDEIIEQLSTIVNKEQFYQYFGNDKIYIANENADKYIKEHQLEYEFYDLPDNTMSLKDYLEKRKSFSNEDIKWQIYQQKLKDEKGLNPNTYFDMADLLIEEGKDKDAIMFLLRGLFFEFNDIQSYIKYKELGIPKSDELVREHQIYLLRGIYDQQMTDLKDYYKSSMVDEVYNTYTKFQPCPKILFEKIIKSMFDGSYIDKVESFERQLSRNFREAYN